MLLKELGGRATTKQVKELAKKRFPDATLWHYVFSQLHSLSKWGYVKRLPHDTWEIIMEYDG